MNAVFKYVLNPGQTALTMPEGSRPLTVANQGNRLCMWVQVDLNTPRHDRRLFEVFMTGEKFDGGAFYPRLKYIGTAHGLEGSIVAHVFEQVAP